MKRIILSSLLLTTMATGALRAQSPGYHPPTPPKPEAPATGSASGSSSSVSPAPPAPIHGEASGSLKAPAAGDPFVKEGTADRPTTGTGKSPSLASAPENFQLFFEEYDVSRADFATLLLDTDGDDAALYTRVNEWIGTPRAKLAEFFACAGRPGSRAVLENIDEVRYPIEFLQPIAEDDHAFPTTFETRNAGESIEFEYTPDEQGQLKTLALALTEVRLARFEDVLGTPDRPTSAFSQPIFSTRKFNATLSLPLNGLRFAGTLSTAKDDTTPADTIRLVFVRSRPAHHTEKPKPAPDATSLRLEYTFYSLERAAARDVLLANSDPQKCHDALRKLVQAGQVRLEHVSSTVTQNGERCVTEEISEIRYGYDFAGPSFPNEGIFQSENSNPSPEPEHPPQPSGPNAPKPAPATNPTTKVTHTANQRVTITNPLPPSAFPKTATLPGVPTSFETRNAGFTAEAEPAVSPDATFVEIQTVPQFVRYLGSLQMTGIGKTYPAQPLFETRKFTGFINAVLGQQELISTFNPPIDTGANGNQDDGRVTLGFLRVVPIK